MSTPTAKDSFQGNPLSSAAVVHPPTFPAIATSSTRRHKTHIKAPCHGADIGAQAGVGEANRQEKHGNEILQPAHHGVAELVLIIQNRAHNEGSENRE